MQGFWSVVIVAIEFLLDLFSGYKSYVAGVGLIGLGLYQISQRQVAEGVASIMAGVGLLAARRSVVRVEAQRQRDLARLWRLETTAALMYETTPKRGKLK